MDTEASPSIELPWHSKEFPWFLNMHWQTLLGLMVAEEVMVLCLRHWSAWDVSFPLIGGAVSWTWSFMQAGWLKKARPDSTVLYWYCAGIVLTLVMWADMERNASSYSTSLIILLNGVVAISGVFAMRLYMLRYFHDSEGIDVPMNRWLTFFFNVIYFQYKFNQVARFRRSHVSAIPTSPA